MNIEALSEDARTFLDTKASRAERHRAFDPIVMGARSNFLKNIKDALWNEARDLHKDGQLKAKSPQAEFVVFHLQSLRERIAKQEQREVDLRSQVIKAYIIVEQAEDASQAETYRRAFLDPLLEGVSAEDRQSMAEKIRGTTVRGHGVYPLDNLADYLNPQSTGTTEV